MGTHGWGARKKHMGSGHRGGFGMAGTGKRADHKKSLVINLYGSKYFGKAGVTSKKTEKRDNKIMNLEFIQKNLEKLKKRFLKNNVLDLGEFKILGKGGLKEALKIKARAVSAGAKEKIEQAGGEITVKEKKEAEKEKSKTSAE